MHWEYSVDPEDSRSHRTDNGQYHRYRRMSHAPQGSRNHNEKSATNVYKYAVDNLNKTYKENNSAKITENENNTQSVYDVTASDYHCKVIKKENTVLYVTAYPEYKEDAEKLVKELGY